MNLTKPAQQAVQEYLVAVNSSLGQLSPQNKSAILNVVQGRIMQGLKARYAGSALDSTAVKAVLAAMGSPEIQANAAAGSLTRQTQAIPTLPAAGSVSTPPALPSKSASKPALPLEARIVTALPMGMWLIFFLSGFTEISEMGLSTLLMRIGCLCIIGGGLTAACQALWRFEKLSRSTRLGISIATTVIGYVLVGFLYIATVEGGWSAWWSTSKTDTVASSEGTDSENRVTICQSTPRELVQTEFAARDAWDTNAIIEFTHPAYQNGVRLLLSMIDKAADFKGAYDALADAMESAYGKDNGVRAMASRIAPADEIRNKSKAEIADVYVQGKVDWSKLKIDVQGDRGSVRIIGKDSDLFQFAKVGDKWYDVPDDVGTPQAFEAAINTQITAISTMTTEVHVLASKVRSGSLTQPQLAAELNAATRRFTSAMARMPRHPGPTPAPPKSKIVDVTSALAALKSADFSDQGMAVAWLDKTEIASPADREAVAVATAGLLSANNPFHHGDFVRLLCKYAGKAQLADLIKLAGSQAGNEWQEAISALFRLDPPSARSVVQRRASDFFFRVYVLELFKKDYDKYSGEMFALLGTANSDLQRDLLRLLGDNGGLEAMPPLREFKAKLGDRKEEAPLISETDSALQAIRKRLVAKGIDVPAEPVTDLSQLGKPKTLDAALEALKSKQQMEQIHGLEWIEKATLDAEGSQKVLAALSGFIKATDFDRNPNKAQIVRLFIALAGAANVDDLATLAADPNKDVWMTAFLKLCKLSQAKAHLVVISRSEDVFFRMDVFKEFKKDAATYEDEVVQCLTVSSRALQTDAVRALVDMGTIKSIRPLGTLKSSLDKKKDGMLIMDIDRAIQAIQLRAKNPPK